MNTTKTARIFLLPGQFQISKHPVVMETLVGSCVTVCLYNSKNHYAAMNHFLMDSPSDRSDLDIGKYGSTATEHIIKALKKFDPTPGHYKAQIFGGAAVIKTNNAANNVGEDNIKMVRKILSEHRIAIIREEIGGSRGRRVRFDTGSNTVFCRFAGQIGKNYNKQ